ncbi:MAG: hypothetical protein ACK4J0_00245 [Candidatus Anstonellaceae archaeon]
MNKWFLLFAFFWIGLLFSQFPPPPPNVLFEVYDSPVIDPSNPPQRTTEITKLKPFFPYLILDCPLYNEGESDCIFTINLVNFTCHYPDPDGIPIDTVHTLTFANPIVVANGERVFFSFDPSNPSNPLYSFWITHPSPIPPNTKSAAVCSSKKYANFSYIIEARRAGLPSSIFEKSNLVNIFHHPPEISFPFTSTPLCNLKFSVSDLDESYGNSVYIKITLSNSTNSCNFIYNPGSGIGYFPPKEKDNCDPFEFSAREMVLNPSPPPINTTFILHLKATYSPYNITVFPHNSYSYTLNNYKKYFMVNGPPYELINFFCNRVSKNYDLFGSAHVFSNKIEIEANATTSRINFNNHFFKNLTIEVLNDQGSTINSYNFSWVCDSGVCSSAQFDYSTNARNLIIDQKTFTPIQNSFNSTLTLDTSRLCPQGDKNKLKIKLFGYGFDWENKELLLYNGKCAGTPHLDAVIYSSPSQKGDIIVLSDFTQREDNFKYIIVELKQLTNIQKPPTLEIKYKTHNDAIVRSKVSSISSAKSIKISYDINWINVSIISPNVPVIYKEFTFPLPPPIEVLERWKIDDQLINEEQKDDILKNKRIYVGEKDKALVNLVFKVPYNIDGYNFDQYLSPYLEGDCSSSSVKSGNEYFVNIDLKKGACIYKIRGKSQTQQNQNPSLSKFLTYIIYSKNFFVPNKPQSFCDSTQLLSSTYYKFFAVALASLILIIGIGYMVGSFLSHPALLEWSKREILEVILLGIFISLVPQFLLFSCSEKISIGSFLNLFPLKNTVVEKGASLLEFVQKIMLDLIERSHTVITILRRDISYFQILASYYHFNSSFVSDIVSFLGVGFSTGFNENPYSGLYLQISVFNFLLQLNNAYLFSALTHYFILFFLSSSTGMIVLLFPFGFLFRCLPFIKNVGSVLIAIGLGFYILFPAAYVIYGLILSNDHFKYSTFCAIFPQDSHCQDCNIYQLSFSENPKCNLIYTNGWEDFKDKKLNYQKDLEEVGSFSKNTFPDQDSITKIQKNKASLQPVYPLSQDSFDPDLTKYFSLTALNFILVLFIPSVILLITLSFVRDIASILGGDIDVSRLMYLA